MNSKEILSNKELHSKILQGVIRLRETVVSTMGANGRYVIIEEENGFCRVTKDGVSVAKAIKFDDKFENMGARFVIDSSISTVDDIGDGTTTTTLIAAWLYELAMKHINSMNHRELTQKITKDMEIALKHVDSFSKIVTTKKELIDVATISANNDKKIGELIGETRFGVGKDGIIKLSRSENGTSYSKIYDGLSIGSGYYSKFFCNTGNKSILNNCYVFSTNHDIKSANDIMRILQFVASSDNNKLFIMANSFSNDFIASMLSNKKNGTFDVCCVETPKMGNWHGIDEDLSVYSDGKFFDISKDTKITDATEDHLGFAMEITTTLNKVTVIPTKKSESHDSWINTLESDIEEKNTEYYKERLRERIARFSGKIATIYVGGETETEHNYLYDIFDDSEKATKNSLISGIAVGGGTVYARISKLLDDDSILGKVLMKPLTQILLNSGFDDKTIEQISDMIINEKDTNYGYNLLSDELKLENLYESGVIEPIGLIKSCIKNSCSVANLLISTHSGIAIIPEQLI